MKLSRQTFIFLMVIQTWQALSGQIRAEQIDLPLGSHGEIQQFIVLGPIPAAQVGFGTLVLENDLDENFKMLKKGECDIIGINLTVTKERSKSIDFTFPHSQTHQVLVQRKPENWKVLSEREINANLLRNQLDLAGKVVYVQKGTCVPMKARLIIYTDDSSFHCI